MNTLSKEDIAAMVESAKPQGSWTVHHTDAVSYVMLRVRTYSGSPVSARIQRLFPIITLDSYGKEYERCRRIDATSTHASRFEGIGVKWFDGKDFTAFATLYDGDMRRSIAFTARVGGELHVQWTTGDGNGYTKEAGLVRDELRIQVTDRRNHLIEFLADVSVTADNSARMVHFSGPMYSLTS